MIRSETRPSPDPERTSPLTRRGMLGLAATGGAAVAVAACTKELDPTSATTSLPADPQSTIAAGTVPPTTAVPPGGAAPAVQLFSDASFNYDALGALGSSAYGLAEVGEVLTITNTVNGAGASYQTYTDTFLAWGDRMANQAIEAGNAGDEVTRAERALRASAYYEHALFYVLGTTQAAEEQSVYEKFRTNWDIAAATLAPHSETVEIPYEQTTMPGWFFAPDDSGAKRPTLILNNGSDGQAADMWEYGASAAVARGWNALVFEGPGQGSMLFVHKLPFRDDWEAVITPVVDFLRDRSDVDADKIALFGLSMGGQLVARAAAYEHRLAALVTAPGCLDPYLGFPEDLRAIVTPDKAGTNQVWNEFVVPDLTVEQKFLLQKRLEPYGEACIDAARKGELPTDFWTPIQIVKGQDITKLVDRITTPVLVIDYEEEQFYPGQAKELFGLLTAPKELATMTVEAGAQLHCSPMAPQVHNEVVFDWLERTVR